MRFITALDVNATIMRPYQMYISIMQPHLHIHTFIILHSQPIMHTHSSTERYLYANYTILLSFPVVLYKALYVCKVCWTCMFVLHVYLQYKKLYMHLDTLVTFVCVVLYAHLYSCQLLYCMSVQKSYSSCIYMYSSKLPHVCICVCVHVCTSTLQGSLPHTVCRSVWSGEVP